MKLYLVRHGTANNRHIDPERKLSSFGGKEVQKTAASATDIHDIKPAHIFHSGKPRAMETAKIIADVTGFKGTVEKVSDLQPMDDPEVWAAKLESYCKDVMLVGHMPFMGRMAILLTDGNYERDLLEFPTAGIACLMKDETETWKLEWTTF